MAPCFLVIALLASMRGTHFKVVYNVNVVNHVSAASKLTIHEMSIYQSKPVLHLQPSSHHFGTSLSHCHYGHGPQSDPIEATVQLRNRLANGALENMPAGFPFHYSMSGCGTPLLSYESYEFREFLSPAGRRPSTRPHVTISFHNPGSQLRHGSPRYLTWSVHTTQYSSALSRKEYSKTPAALVKLDPALLNTSYGRFLRKTPTVLLRALSISLELGVPITITSLDKPVLPLMPYARTRDRWQIGDVVYIGTTPDGRQEVLYVTRNS
ncbi:hypothetical protein PTI98_008874 [Pleurotus ostreatus]|nr:hypothetical protein PTI98_008874 [Pleurotus ostreatus]